MSEENQTAEEVKEEATSPLDAASSASEAEADNGRDKKGSAAIEAYFAKGVRLLTLPGSSLVVNDDTRRVLALFFGGRFFVGGNPQFCRRGFGFLGFAPKKKTQNLKTTHFVPKEKKPIYNNVMVAFLNHLL
mgnify:CR=1 FL=1